MLLFPQIENLNLMQLFPQMEDLSYQTMADRRLVGLVASYCCLPQFPFLYNLLSLDLMMSNQLLEFEKEKWLQSKSPALIGHATSLIEKGLARKYNLFLFLFSGSNIRARRARRTPPAAGWFGGVASDSNRLLWRFTNPQRFGPHLGIRPVLDQSEAMGSSGV
jgi:hypothetical protein